MGCGFSSKKHLQVRHHAIVAVLTQDNRLPKPVMDGLGKLLYGKAESNLEIRNKQSRLKNELTSVSTFRIPDEEVKLPSAGTQSHKQQPTSSDKPPQLGKSVGEERLHEQKEEVGEVKEVAQQAPTGLVEDISDETTHPLETIRQVAQSEAAGLSPQATHSESALQADPKPSSEGTGQEEQAVPDSKTSKQEDKASAEFELGDATDVPKLHYVEELQANSE
jgi:hypothetical protein